MEKRLKESWDELVPRVDDLGEFLNLPHPEAALGMENEFRAAETAGQEREDFLIGTALFLAGGVAGSATKAVATMALKRLGQSAATAGIIGGGAKLLTAGGVTAADVYNSYRTGVRDAIDTVMQEATAAQGKPIDWSDPVARHDALSNNPNLQKTITNAGMQSAIATFFGNKAGALTGKIVDVAAPGVNGLQKLAVETATSESTEEVIRQIFRSHDK